ncbi:MAG: phosphatase [Cyclobacteriaceae bacterium]|jgi:exopolyphosphatase/guanosine-5'-triphosphate,3'-diphosphate pyrophosphatase
MSQKVATIDLGTNTFHLLVAELQKENTFQVIHHERIPVMIGRGGINQGVITPEAQERALEALHHFRAQLQSLAIPLENVHCTATSAFRNAKNGQEFAQKILEETDIIVDIIPGDQEAEFIYYGVREAVSLGEQNALIMDIGGGSVEFILCNQNKILWKHSFEIGAQRLLDRFDIQDPISQDNIQALKHYFSETLTPLAAIVAQYHPQTLVGASGTFDTLSDIHVLENKLTIAEGATELPLTYSAFQKMLEEFSQKTRQERLIIPGMIDMRVDMIVVASWLIRFVLEEYQILDIRISSYALKEGLLVELAKRI